MKLFKSLILIIFICGSLYLLFVAEKINAPVQTQKKQLEEQVQSETQDKINSTPKKPQEEKEQNNKQKNTAEQKELEKEEQETNQEPQKIKEQKTGQFILDVPFVVQATSNQWSDPRFQDACEETTALIAVSWARGESLTQATNTAQVKKMAEFQSKNYGDYRDTSSLDSVERLYKAYFNFKQAEVKKDISVEEIIAELEIGNLVVVPANGQALNNPYFTGDGPERHMLILKGYDYDSQEFIANDPGIGKGQGYRYAKDLLYNAIRDYVSGYHQPFPSIDQKNIIVVYKELE